MTSSAPTAACCHPNPAVHQPAAKAWATWEQATVTLVEDADMISLASDPLAAVATARLESHYFTHGGWLSDNQLTDQAHRLAHSSRRRGGGALALVLAQG